jgi:hypothetical protein
VQEIRELGEPNSRRLRLQLDLPWQVEPGRNPLRARFRALTIRYIKDFERHAQRGQARTGPPRSIADRAKRCFGSTERLDQVSAIEVASVKCRPKR